MENSYVLYGNCSRRQHLAELLSLQKPTAPSAVISKAKAEDLTTFLMDAKLKGKMEEKLTIESIEISQGIVKHTSPTISQSITYHFTAKSAYVATIDKHLMEEISDFYKKVLSDGRNKGSKVVFDASKEANLQKALGLQFTSVLPSQNNSLGKTSVDQQNFSQSKVKKLTKEPKKTTGYASVFMLGTIAAILLTFASILIGIKILNP